MIKKTAFLYFLSFSSLSAFDLVEPAFGLWGLGGSVKNTPYQNQSSQSSLNPYIFGGYGVLNIEANRANINLYSFDSGLSFAVLGQYRTHQSIDNDDVGERDEAVELGLQLQYPLGLGFTSRLSFLQDISNKHKSNELELQVYRHDDIGSFSLLSSLSLQRESSGLLDYYYGTDDYTPEAGLAGELEVILTYPINDWALFTGVRYYVYDKEVRNSPITDASTITQAFVGVGYRF